MTTVKTTIYKTKRTEAFLEAHNNGVSIPGEKQESASQIITDCLEIGLLYLQGKIKFNSSEEEMYTGLQNKIISSKRRGKNAISNSVQNKSDGQNTGLGNLG